MRWKFHPSLIAGRILAWATWCRWSQRPAAANIDAEKAARTAERKCARPVRPADMREQLMQMASMGGISGYGMMPGIAKMKTDRQRRYRRQDHQRQVRW